MTAEEWERAERQVQEHEGWRDRPYRCTAGALTIGYGTNLDAGIDQQEGLFLLRHRLERCVMDLHAYQWYAFLDPVRQTALLDMRYQLGRAGFRTFRKMLAALEAHDIPTAVREARDSKWARVDTPARAATVTRQLETGLP